MPLPTPCQLLVDPPADGAWNMAVDEVLLAATTNSDQPTLRFYQWQRPTLSLGYFQKYADRSLHPASQSADVVRRLSGGGAIVHDQELTYSLMLPTSHPLARDTQALYDAVHQAIIESLNAILTSGLTSASAWQPVLCNPSTKLAAGDEPFLCFERRSKGDILLRKKESMPDLPEKKIVGSAQRRRQGVVLQHGSILLRQSQVAPELAGIAEITHKNISPTDMLPPLLDTLAKKLALDLNESTLSKELAAESHEIQQKKYQAANWTERR